MTIKTGALLVLNTSISAASAMYHLQFFMGVMIFMSLLSRGSICE